MGTVPLNALLRPNNSNTFLHAISIRNRQGSVSYYPTAWVLPGEGKDIEKDVRSGPDADFGSVVELNNDIDKRVQ